MKNSVRNDLIPFFKNISMFVGMGSIHGVYTSTGGLLSAFMLLEQLFKVAPCGLV